MPLYFIKTNIIEMSQIPQTSSKKSEISELLTAASIGVIKSTSEESHFGGSCGINLTSR